MPASLVEILNELERIAAYDGPWKPLRRETRALGSRVRELVERESHEDDVLVIALVGGSGVGKSTVLNALAGDHLAETSEFRPCTSQPTVYHPPGVSLEFGAWRRISGSALENLVIVDTPDSDTVVREHRALVADVLAKCDLIMLCGSQEKYLDEATWSLLRPLQGERSMVCIETKAQGPESIEEHWRARLREQGFQVAAYFRINALRTLDRKLAGNNPGETEFDFPKLERFLHNELSTERIARIKRANAAGLLAKTVARLEDCVAGLRPAVDALNRHLVQGDKAIARESLGIVESRLFTETYLWHFALGREVGLRAKGIAGTLYRMVEAVRSLPARAAGWLPWNLARPDAGRRAASLLISREVFEEDLALASEEITRVYRNRQSELGFAFARTGFDPPTEEAGLDEYRKELNERVAAVLRGPGREDVVRRARWLTGWPAVIAADSLPVLFLFYAGYRIVHEFFTPAALPPGYITHALMVLVILLGAELFVLSLLARAAAWAARTRALNALQIALYAPDLAFRPERRILEDARRLLDTVDQLKRAIPQ